MICNANSASCTPFNVIVTRNSIECMGACWDVLPRKSQIARPPAPAPQQVVFSSRPTPVQQDQNLRTRNHREDGSDYGDNDKCGYLTSLIVMYYLLRLFVSLLITTFNNHLQHLNIKCLRNPKHSRAPRAFLSRLRGFNPNYLRRTLHHPSTVHTVKIETILVTWMSSTSLVAVIAYIIF